MSAAGFKRVAKVIGLWLLALGMLVAAGWGVLMLIYWDHAIAALRVTLAAAYGLISLALLAGFVWPRGWRAAQSRWRASRWLWRAAPGRWQAFGAFAALFALLLVVVFHFTHSH